MNVKFVKKWFKTRHLPYACSKAQGATPFVSLMHVSSLDPIKSEGCVKLYLCYSKTINVTLRAHPLEKRGKTDDYEVV